MKSGLESGLKEFISQTVYERWHEENNEFLMGHGFERDVLKNPEKIPPTQPGDFKGSSLDYNPKFPEDSVEPIYLAADSKESAKMLIDKVFEKIKRGTYPDLVMDGDHHSPTYGEPFFTRFYIDTGEAYNFLESL